MQVQVRYPEYLRQTGSGEFDIESTYQAGLRIREGSHVTLLATSSVPVGSAEVAVKSKDELIEPDADFSDDRSQVAITLRILVRLQ